MGNEETIKEGLRRFENHVSGKELVPADLRSAVYRAAVTVGDLNTLETMLKLYRSTDLEEERSRILSSLTGTENENFLNRVLDLSLSKEVKPQHTVLIMVHMAYRSYKGRILAWQLLKDNYKIFVDRYSEGSLLKSVTKGTTERFVSEEYADEVEEFFKNHPTPCSERSIQQSIEAVRLNAAWLKRDEKAIENFLSKF